jgi:salicylate hydroxylase
MIETPNQCNSAVPGELPIQLLMLRVDTYSSQRDSWNNSASPQQLIATFANLDPCTRQIMLHSKDIKLWRLCVHIPYPYWTRGRVALLGDATHPMLPDQTQGHSQAIENAVAMGLIFSKQCFKVDVGGNTGRAIERALRRYERIRMSRAAPIQSAMQRHGRASWLGSKGYEAR